MEKEKENFTIGLNFLQKIAYYLLYGIVYVISILPDFILHGLSYLIYLILFKLVRYRVDLVRKNLADSFPEKSASELKRIEKDFQHFFCDYIVETIQQTSMSEEEMKRRVKYTGMDHVNHLLEEGKDVILYIGHYGNWEWITGFNLYIQGKARLGQIYHILNSPVINALMLKIRSAMGSESISMNVTLRTILTKKKKGIPMVLGFISDQVPIFQATYHSLNLLNHPGTLVITGTERIAKQYGFACVYLDVKRPRRGYYEVNIIPMQEGSKDIPDWQITDEYFRLLEDSIKRNPAIWLWTHNRWKRTQEDWDRWKAEQQEKKG